jgi:hypothetical protein
MALTPPPVPSQGADEPISRPTPPPRNAFPGPPLGTQGLFSDPAAAGQMVSDVVAEVARRMQAVALMSGDIEKNWRSMLDHQTRANEVSRLAVLHTQRQVAQTQARAQDHPAHGATAADIVQQRREHFDPMAGFPAAPAPADARPAPASPTPAAPPAPAAPVSPTAPAPSAPAAPTAPTAPAPSAQPAPFEQAPPTRGQDTGRTTESGAPVPADLPEARSPQQPTREPMDYEAGRAVFTDAQQIRQAAARGANRWLSTRMANPAYSQVEGQWVDRANQPVAQEVGERFARRMNRMGRISGALDAVGGGEGMSGALGALGGTAARFAGPIGMAVGATVYGLHQATNQRESNRFYQQISGGSNFSGFRERAREAGFSRLRMAGTMDSGQASELFRGVSEMGVTGQNRTNALDFAVDNFRRYGTDVQTSMQLISDSIANGVKDFTTLRSSLDSVSETARQTGVNVSEAQRAFARTNQAVQQGVTAGPQSSAIAAAVQNRVTQLGHSAMAGVDFNGMLTQQGMLMQSGVLGQDYNQMMASIQGGDTGLLGQGMDAAIRQAVVASGLDVNQVQQIKQQLVGDGPISAQDAQNIATEMARQGHPVDINATIALAESVGVRGVTPANASQWLITAALGGFNMQERLSSAATGASGHTRSTGQIGTTGGGRDLITEGEARTGDQRSALRHQREGIFGALGYEGQPHSDPMTGAITMGNAAEEVPKAARGATEGYVNRVQESGQRDPVVESLLATKAHMADSSFRVKTAEGTRDVSLETAVRYYSDQLARGDVQIATGTGAGKTVADVTGVVDPNREVTSDKQSAQGTERERSGQTKNAHASIEVGLTPEARRLFQVSTTSPNADASRRSGVPADAFVNPAERPSATAPSVATGGD